MVHKAFGASKNVEFHFGMSLVGDFCRVFFFLCFQVFPFCFKASLREGSCGRPLALFPGT